MNDARIIVDGGTINTHPGRMYGAFRTIIHTTTEGITTTYQTKPIKVVTDLFGDCNQAEFLAALYGVKNLEKQIVSMGLDPREYSVHIVSDSKNMVYQTRGEWNIRSDIIQALRERLQDRLDNFRFYYLRWVPRKIIYSELGC